LNNVQTNPWDTAKRERKEKEIKVLGYRGVETATHSETEQQQRQKDRGRETRGENYNRRDPAQHTPNIPTRPTTKTWRPMQRRRQRKNRREKSNKHKLTEKNVHVDSGQ
jgi:hypothetical protein